MGAVFQHPIPPSFLLSILLLSSSLRSDACSLATGVRGELDHLCVAGWTLDSPPVYLGYAAMGGGSAVRALKPHVAPQVPIFCLDTTQADTPTARVCILGKRLLDNVGTLYTHHIL